MSQDVTRWHKVHLTAGTVYSKDSALWDAQGPATYSAILFNSSILFWILMMFYSFYSDVWFHLMSLEHLKTMSYESPVVLCHLCLANSWDVVMISVIVMFLSRKCDISFGVIAFRICVVESGSIRIWANARGWAFELPGIFQENTTRFCPICPVMARHIKMFQMFQLQKLQLDAAGHS